MKTRPTPQKTNLHRKEEGLDMSPVLLQPALAPPKAFHRTKPNLKANGGPTTHRRRCLSRAAGPGGWSGVAAGNRRLPSGVQSPFFLLFGF